jgi:hypothetical protein
MCSTVRVLTDSPLPQRPSLQRILLAVLQSTQSFYSKLESTGQPWSLKPDYLLAVANNTSDYLLAIDPSYGKPIQVLTYWPQNPSLPQRYVDFTVFNDLNFDWGLPVNVASFTYTDGSPNTAVRMAFFNRDDGSRYVRVLPQPQLAGSYLVTFESGDWASSAAIEDSPVLSQFHSLIEIWAALSVLPSCQWVADQSYNMAHRKEIASALLNDRVRVEDDFDLYRRNMIRDHMTIRASSLDDGAGGWG